MKAFLSQRYIDRLNRLYNGGVFFRAAVVFIRPGLNLYFADTQDYINFQGNDYTPLQMRWDGMEATSQMSLPSISVTVPNIDGQIGAYLESPDSTVIIGREVILQLLHMDLLGTTTDVDSARLSILAVDWTWELATFHLGLDLGLQEVLPKGLISAEEFPGSPEGLRRASIL